MLKVCLITATKDRHTQLERVVRFALDQTYENILHLIYNNSSIEQRLNTNLPQEKFLLINNHINLKTGKPYETLGDIYNDILTFVPDDIDVINFMDDDDIFMENHVEEGIKGLLRGNKKAYKPKFSWYRHGKSIDKVNNVLEPSIFVMASHVKQYGFGAETTAQHHKWLRPLEINNEIFIDPDGPSTYVCDWSQTIPTFKTSGDPNNPNNFANYSKNSKDSGDKIITPCNKSWANHYRRI